MDAKLKPVVFIVGQTGTGKTDLAVKLAKKYSGEIICADSRTIYKGMDLGTAKPDQGDQDEVVHHGLDLINPDESYSAAKFKDYAETKIIDLQNRNRLPFVVGGTGLYIDGIVYDFSFSKLADPSLRLKLEELNITELQILAEKKGIKKEDINYKNQRHLARAIERGGVIKQPKVSKENFLIIAFDIDKAVLDKRIAERVDKILKKGFLEEVKKLVKLYGPSAPGLLAPGYKAYIKYLEGKISYSAARDEFIKADKSLAKRQKTWFKRNKNIVWVKSLTEADIEVKNFLSKFDTIRM